MPRFFFHVRDGGRPVGDASAHDLPSLDAARGAAVAAVREAASGPAGAVRDLGRRRFDIADERGRLLATVAVRDVSGLH